MADTPHPASALPEEARAIIWRILGTGGSPLTGRSTYELVPGIVSAYVAETDSTVAVETIRGWFEPRGERYGIIDEMKETVATLIVEGIGTDRSETAAWAIGSIEHEMAARIMVSRWSEESLDSFIGAAIGALARACRKDRVLEAGRSTRIELGSVGADARIPRDSLVRAGRIETFQTLLDHGMDLVLLALHPSVANLIELVLALRPDRTECLIDNLDHPVVQARAAWTMVRSRLPSNHRAPLDLIRVGSSDAAIALGIVHTLRTVNGLDHDIRMAASAPLDWHTWTTELHPSVDDLDGAAAKLLTGLADRLSLLDPMECAQWIGETLAVAPSLLSSGVKGEKPVRLQQLEDACIKILAQPAQKPRPSCFRDLIAAMRKGLSTTHQPTWSRHLAGLAWAIRDVAPARAAQIARTALVVHLRHVGQALEHNGLYLDWDSWDHREWIRGLGACLALSDDQIDVMEWVERRCQELPLSAWDADGNTMSFMTAERLARHWFLVAFHALEIMEDLGNARDPSTVCTLAEALWAHCRFAKAYLHGTSPETSLAAEYAMRCAVQFGQAGDQWLLKQARSPAVGPRVLWAAIDQRVARIRRQGLEGEDYSLFVAAYAVAASERFGDGSRFSLYTLRYWGQLWLALGAIDEAERTATAMLTFPRMPHDRADTILLVMLLARVASKRPLPRTTQEALRSLYDDLWSVYTPGDERDDRKQVNAWLRASGLRA